MKRKWKVELLQSLLLFLAEPAEAAARPQRYLRSKVVGGSMIDEETKYPYFVSLGLEMPNSEYLLFCGGTLIDETVVLTAAHCLDNLPGLEVGVSDSSYVHAESWILHPHYNSTSLQHDIALVFLEEKPASSTVTASLVSTVEPNNVSDNNMITTIGIGHTNKEEAASISWNNFKEANLEIVSNLQRDCSDRYSTPTMTLHPDQQFCANGQEEAACNGDSGGPAIDQNGSIVGIVSFGACQINVPTVFTDVSYYLPWIYHLVCTYHTSKSSTLSYGDAWLCDQQQEQQTTSSPHTETKREASLFGTTGGGYSALVPAAVGLSNRIHTEQHSGALSGFQEDEEEQQARKPTSTSNIPISLEESPSNDGSSREKRKPNQHAKDEDQSIFYNSYKAP